MSNIDAYTASTLFDRLLARGFEPSETAVRFHKAITTDQTPDARLEAARARLRAAMLADDQSEIAAAQQAVSECSNIQAAWQEHEAMLREYAVQLVREIAEPAFAHVRGLYNQAGAEFAKALSTVDPNADPDAIMSTGTAAEREAYVAVPALAAELDKLSVLLGDVVATRRRYRPGRTVHRAGYALGLLVKIRDAHVRRLVEAWCWEGYHPRGINTRPPSALDKACMGRGGIWAAIVAFGAELAVPIDRLADYRPLEIAERIQVSGRVVDPYDCPAAWREYERHQAAAAAQATRQRAAIRAAGGVA